MIRRVIFPFFLLTFLLCAAALPVNAQSAGGTAKTTESEVQYYVADRVRQLAYPIKADSEAACIVSALEPAKELANTAYPVRAAFLEKQKDGGKRLFYVSNSQVYEAVSGQCYESTQYQRTRLATFFFAHTQRQSGGTPFWLAYMSPGKLTKIGYEAEYWGNWLDDTLQTHGDSYKVELFPASEHLEEYAWVLQQLSKFSNCAMEEQYETDVIPSEGHHMLILRFDTGVFYRFLFNETGFFLYASDLDRTIRYATPDSTVQYELVTCLNNCAKEFGNYVHPDMNAGL